MCAYLCVSVRVSLLESFESEDSCWLHHLPVFARVPSLNRKWQEANQKVQELQASQEVRADQEQRIKVSGPCLVGFTVLVQPPVTHGHAHWRPGKLAACVYRSCSHCWSSPCAPGPVPGAGVRQKVRGECCSQEARTLCEGQNQAHRVESKRAAPQVLGLL